MKARANTVPSPASRRAMEGARNAICLRHRNPALRSQFATTAAMATVPEMTDIVLATGPKIGDLDPTAALFNKVPISKIIFQYFRMGAEKQRIVNAKRGPGAEIQVGRISTKMEILTAERYTFGMTDDWAFQSILGGSPIDRQRACTETARVVTIRSCAKEEHWDPINDTTSGDTYHLVTDVTGNAFNVAGTMDAYLTDGERYFRSLGIGRDQLELALFGDAQDAAIMDARFRDSRMGTEAALKRPDAAAIRDYLKIQAVHMIPSALGMLEEPVPGADPVFVDLLPSDLAVLFYRGLPRSTQPNDGEQFWAWDFELQGHPTALEPIQEYRNTSTIWAWEDCRRTLFQPAFALAWENTYEAETP